uniref:choice-of-anchor Q domain-containing protein n=1 Tax=Paraconexibacter sp. TaxID=2949640 RepID=UPI003566A129
ARLQPLGDYGGPTDTRPPLTTSATRDAASACEAAGGDQRGAPAPAGPACDIGAAELGADLATLLTASRGSAPAGSDVTYYARVKNLGSDLAPSTTLDFAVPAGAELVSIETSQGTCAATTCALGSLASGADALVAMVLRAPAPGPFTVGASSGSGIPDPAGANNAATVSTEVVPAPAPGTSTQTITVTVPTSIAPTTVAADTAPPVLGSVKLVGNARRGKTIRLRGSLSESAKVTMTVYRLTTGRRVGSACRSRRKTGRTCTITTRRGAVTVSAKAGKAVTFTLPAEIAKKTLPTGRYRVTLVAKDAAGNASRARTRTVTVKR